MSVEYATRPARNRTPLQIIQNLTAGAQTWFIAKGYAVRDAGDGLQVTPEGYRYFIELVQEPADEKGPAQG